MPTFQSISELIKYLKQHTVRHLDQEQIDKLTKLIQYPRLNKALRYNQIKWTGTDGVAIPVEAEAKSPSIPEHFEGKTKDGKRYVRVSGTLEQANTVFEHYKNTYQQIEPPRKDRFKRDTYFFYLS
jgi:predicted class III extradiol MEMO1 family dioxygenase